MTLKLFVVAQNKPDVLARVAMLFHRSAVDIESIRMPARRKRNELKITITLDGKNPNAHRMAAILEKLVDVVSVEMPRHPNTKTGRNVSEDRAFPGTRD
jgi:acetolactate synthase small subunit